MANFDSKGIDSEANQFAEDSAEKTVRPANETLFNQSDAKAAAEAVRVGLKDYSSEAGAVVPADQDHMASGRSTVADDPGALQEQAKVVGEEAVGGTTPTPDQSNVDAVAAAAGVKTRPERPVKVYEEMRKRDQHRHELDPESKGPAASA